MLITISALPRVSACLASGVLEPIRDITPSPSAARGTAIHAFLRDCNTLGVAGALERVPESERALYETIDLEQLPISPANFVAEVGFAYDWEADTARELFRGDSSRSYEGLKETELAGTADVVGLTDTSVVILDWKTGYRHLGDPSESLQLRAYALAAARAYGRGAAEVGFVCRPTEAEPRVHMRSLEFLELELSAQTIRELMSRVHEARRAPQPPAGVVGPHCRYCPALGRCSEASGLVRELARAPQEPLPVLDEQTAPLVYQRWVAAQVTLERVEEGLKAYAQGSPIRLPDGRVWGPVSVGREVLDPIRGAAALVERFGPDIVDLVVEREPELTKASLERGLRRWMGKNPGHRVSKLKAEAEELMRAAGAATKRTRIEWREHTPKPEGGGEWTLSNGNSEDTAPPDSPPPTD